ncbi:DMT family transporter [Mangrovicoccus sp. HB161399]|uniref:DMT family transporter n=1 Tax=Mangrovicoccus sp. HB161399 TaxID=2720392 RepID=UPI0015550508|nr:DMT family transporter [Mangrovicoccus sp. HB161399]
MAVQKSRAAGDAAAWAELAVLGVALVWGASYPVAKGALAHMPVLVLIFLRFLLTAAVMSSLARRELRRAPRRDLAAAMALGVILTGIFFAETWGVAATSAANAALIISLCTVFTPFLDYGLRRQLPPGGVILGAGIAVGGVGALAGGPAGFGAGDLLVLCAAGLRAAMVVATKRLTAGRALSSAALTAVQSATVAGLALILIAGLSGPGVLRAAAVPEAWMAVAFLSLFCTIGAFYVQNAAVRRSSPTRVSFLMGTEPLFGLALACLLLSEPAGPATVAGAGLIVGGTFLGLASERRGRS